MEFISLLNKKIYYGSVLLLILMMTVGVAFGFVDKGLSFQWIFHFVLATSVSVCLLLYPKWASPRFRILVMFIGTVYFYMLFMLYPDNWSNFIFLCFTPAIAILFFDAKIFYFSIIANFVFICATMIYLVWFSNDARAQFFQEDPIGNVLNFISSQVVIYLIFSLTYGRIKKQKLYFEQMKQSERLKTTGQLAAAVAHEIRNPLTVVKGFLQLYKEDGAMSSAMKKNLNMLVEELDTAEKVISQFLSLSKPNKNTQTEQVNVHHVLQSVTDLLHSYGLLHDNEIELKVHEECCIAANTMEIKQLLVNIIKNAIEASDIGEKVIVEASRVKEWLEIKVTDFGQGMTKEELDSLGTPFYSLKSKGTGLGLMICYNIAETYKGTITFDSVKGEGTTVTIRFPLQM